LCVAVPGFGWERGGLPVATDTSLRHTLDLLDYSLGLADRHLILVHQTGPDLFRIVARDADTRRHYVIGRSAGYRSREFDFSPLSRRLIAAGIVVTAAGVIVVGVGGSVTFYGLSATGLVSTGGGSGVGLNALIAAPTLIPSSLSIALTSFIDVLNPAHHWERADIETELERPRLRNGFFMSFDSRSEFRSVVLQLFDLTHDIAP
jgi:hypothetical protein